jgi:hypothetical protein
MEMEPPDILNYLEATAASLQWDGSPIEILLIGQLPAHRVTQDCDIMHLCPKEAQQAVLDAAAHVAVENGLPKTWLNTQAMDLNVLPDGWPSTPSAGWIC